MLSFNLYTIVHDCIWICMLTSFLSFFVKPYPKFTSSYQGFQLLPTITKVPENYQDYQIITRIITKNYQDYYQSTRFY